MKQPIEPKKEDCCNSGCNPCIFEVYEKQLKVYQKFKQCGEIIESFKVNSMSQLEYQPFMVVRNIDICEQHRLLQLKQNDSTRTRGSHLFWSPGEHFLIKYTTETSSCSRAYTPIKIDLDDDHDFAVIVKRYDNGIVSNYLYNLQVGENTLWRGPYGHYDVDFNKINRIVMVAQGTGISPMFTIIKNILIDEENFTRIILYYCCKRIDTILLRNELYAFQSYWNFDYSIHLSEKSNDNLLKYKEPISGRLSKENVDTLKPFTEKDQFVLCGSVSFMKYYHFWLVEQNFPSQNIVKL